MVLFLLQVSYIRRAYRKCFLKDGTEIVIDAYRLSWALGLTKSEKGGNAEEEKKEVVMMGLWTCTRFIFKGNSLSFKYLMCEVLATKVDIS